MGTEYQDGICPEKISERLLKDFRLAQKELNKMRCHVSAFALGVFCKLMQIYRNLIFSCFFKHM